jgi:hypothetical protein
MFRLGPLARRRRWLLPHRMGLPVSATVTSAGPFLLSTASCFLQTPCQLSLRFQHSTTGAQSGAVVVTAARATTSSGISPSGTGGEPAVSLSTSSLMFDPHASGSTSVSQTVALTNTGNITLSISGMNFGRANPGEFPIENTTCASGVAAGAICTMAISFSPTATGARGATLQIVSNAREFADCPPVVRNR